MRGLSVIATSESELQWLPLARLPWNSRQYTALAPYWHKNSKLASMHFFCSIPKSLLKSWNFFTAHWLGVFLEFCCPCMNILEFPWPTVAQNLWIWLLKILEWICKDLWPDFFCLKYFQYWPCNVARDGHEWPWGLPVPPAPLPDD